MKILLMGDASNYHRCLSVALRKLGHDVTVASNGSGWMDTARDIDLSRPSRGKLGGLLLWLRLKRLLPRFKGYDVVQIHNPIFLNLKPGKVRKVFDFLKRNNRSVFLTALGTDAVFVKSCVTVGGPLRYNEWMIDGEPGPLQLRDRETMGIWLSSAMMAHCKYIYDNVDGIVTALYEYHRACLTEVDEDKMAYAGIPIDTEKLQPVKIDGIPVCVNLFLGMHRDRMVEKGTDRILAAARKVVEKYPGRCRLTIVENRPYEEYIGLLKDAHVVLDQLYSYTPATNALLAMAYGITAVTGAEPEFYDFIGEQHNRPIVNAVPDDEQLFSTLEQIVLHPELIVENTWRNREFVEKHNDAGVVASRFVEFWNRQLNKKQ